MASGVSAQDAAFVPHLCQNGRETAVASGHSRAPRTTSDLGTRRLTHCAKRPSKQPVMKLAA